MFVGYFKLTSDDLPAMLRVDLLDEGATGLYELVDPDGQEHVWRWDLTEDTESERFDQRSWFALVMYLSHCIGKGWSGIVTPVMVATGLDLGSFCYLANIWNVERSSQKPEGSVLQ
jgi:hypothetical protein